MALKFSQLNKLLKFRQISCYRVIAADLISSIAVEIKSHDNERAANAIATVLASAAFSLLHFFQFLSYWTVRQLDIVSNQRENLSEYQKRENKKQLDMVESGK